MERRDWLARVARSGAAGGAALTAPGAFADGPAPGGSRGRGAYAEGFDEALDRLGAADATPDERLVVEVAEEAWSGAFVTVLVDGSGLGRIGSLHVFRDDHVPARLVSFEPRRGLPARLALPVRLERPCGVHAFARTSEGWVRASGRVRAVGAPGCG